MFFFIVKFDSGFQLWWSIYKYIHSLAIFGFLIGFVSLVVRIHFNIAPLVTFPKDRRTFYPASYKFDRRDLTLSFSRYLDGVTNKDKELRVKWQDMRKERTIGWFMILWLRVEEKGFLIPIGAEKEEYDRMVSILERE